MRAATRTRVCGALTALTTLVTLAPTTASAKRVVEVQLTPGAGDYQIAIWIEDATGAFVDTAYVTRLTGQFGLGNRPGAALLKTDFRWPYGRREMVLPIWSHRRNHHYPRVVMGGDCAGKSVNSTTSPCGDMSLCGGDCDDTTIAYHPRVSSSEPFYCSPSGASSIDAMSCASKGTFSKGAFADPPAFSLYPPRADLTVLAGSDSVDAAMFASDDDLVAISGATPQATALFAATWLPPDTLPAGSYVAWVEASEESDFNGSHDHPNQSDSVSQWNFEGHPFLGQPSVIYEVPFTLGDAAAMTSSAGTAMDYAGYGTWDGSDGVLHPADATISVGTPGSGAERLLPGPSGARVTVLAGGCTPGAAPDAVATPALTPAATAITVAFTTPPSGIAPARFDIRYHSGTTPITDATFDQALAPTFAPPPPGAPGSSVSTTIDGLTPSQDYVVAIRALTLCGDASPVTSAHTTTPAQAFATLQGCFVATAAFGAPDDRSVLTLRRLRDRALLAPGNAAGRLFVASYYALSPSLANAIATDTRLRAAARAALAPLVQLSTIL